MSKTKMTAKGFETVIGAKKALKKQERGKMKTVKVEKYVVSGPKLERALKQVKPLVSMSVLGRAATQNALLGFIPDWLKRELSGRQLGDVMLACFNAYWAAKEEKQERDVTRK